MSAVHVPTVITDGGPWATHDQACAVCSARPAVLNLNAGVFEPCWECQERGWEIHRRPRIAGKQLRQRDLS